MILRPVLLPRQHTTDRKSWPTTLSLILCHFLTGCDHSQHPNDLELSAAAEPPAQTVTISKKTDEYFSFQLYSTLPGKMARMEELLNAIDRFLDDPEFQDRLLADAKEFHQLVTESRGQYPEKLSLNDQSQFDHTIEQTAIVSKKLIDSLETNNVMAVREALEELDSLRQEGHTRFSY